MILRFLSYLMCWCCLCFSAQAQEEQFFEPIDVVYLWVDGNDANWQHMKEQCALLYGGANIKPDANAKNRYSDNDELKYSLRSVWKYASFVNHIYIVTMNQRPAWLADHPKITVIDHTEIFKNMENLPTFNSMAIECHLHRIPHLSEHFIYFNDDMFFGKKVNPSDFFSMNGKVRVLFEQGSYTPDGVAKKKEITYLSACRNTNNFLNQQFKHERRLFVCHAPYALSKSYMQDTVQAFPEIFEKTSAHRFRCAQDYTITNGLLQYHWEYQDRIQYSKLKNLMIYLFDDNELSMTLKYFSNLKKYRPHTFCLQDKMIDSSPQTKRALHAFFEEWFPEAAPWEK